MQKSLNSFLHKEFIDSQNTQFNRKKHVICFFQALAESLEQQREGCAYQLSAL